MKTFAITCGYLDFLYSLKNYKLCIKYRIQSQKLTHCKSKCSYVTALAIALSPTGCFRMEERYERVLIGIDTTQLPFNLINKCRWETLPCTGRCRTVAASTGVEVEQIAAFIQNLTGQQG